jgi:zinc finger protein
MADSCDACGYKSAEIKGGGGISDRGRAITLRVSEQDDLRRDVIKSDSATVRVPCRWCAPGWHRARARC